MREKDAGFEKVSHRTRYSKKFKVVVRSVTLAAS